MSNITKKVIKASAGTGKTYQLSVEYLALLSKGVPYPSILVVTFTRKATAEIKHRIFSMLHTLTEEGETAQKKDISKTLAQILPTGFQIDFFLLAQVYKDMRLNKNKIQILTIDSFIQSIFSGLIAPYLNIHNFSLISESLNDEYLEMVLLEMIRNKENWKVFKQFIEQNSYKKNLAEYKKLLTEVVSQRTVIASLDYPKSAKNVPLEEIQDYFDQLLALMDSHIAEALPRSEQYKAGWEPVIEYAKEPTAEKFLRLIKNESKRLLKEDYFWKIKPFSPIHENLLEIYLDFRQQLSQLLYVQKVVPYMDALKVLSALIYEEYDKVKFREKKFTHQDILFYTYSYLYSEELSVINKEQFLVQNYFYEMLNNKIQFMLIDEFQDTSVLQWNIVSPIINECVADETQLGGVVCVGDEKQAIYSWRGGEQGLLLFLPQILNVEEQILNTSYRSNATIIDFINRMFGRISELVEDFQYLKWPYFKVIPSKTETTGYVEVRVAKASSDTEDEVMEGFVRNLQELAEAKKIDLSKTAIIVRKNTEMDRLSNFLEAAGIAHILESALSIMDNPVIKPLIYFLQYVVYKDFIYLLKFLRSDLCQISSQQLKEILAKYRALEGNLKHQLQSYAEFEVLNDVTECLERLKPNLPVNLVVREVMAHFNFAQVFTDSSSSRNLLKLIQVADLFMSSNAQPDKTILGFLQYLDLHRKDEELKQVSAGEKNVLQLITVHKSKGLEYENVFYYWDIAPKSPNSSGLKVSHKYDDKFQCIEASLCYDNDDHNILKNIPFGQALITYDQEKDFMESINNIYVACTRARTNLFLYCITRKKLDAIEKMSKFSESKSDNLYYLGKEAILAASRQKLSALGDACWSTGVLEEQNLQPQAQPTSCVLDKEYYNYATQLLPMSNTLEEKILFAKEHYLIKQEIGNIAHEYLSHLKYNQPAEQDKAKRQVFAKYGTHFSQERLESIIQQINANLGSRQELFSSNWEVYTEQVVFDSQNEYRLDRFMVDKVTKEVRIIDYKTGEEKDPYQLDLYIKLVAKLPFIKGKGYNISASFAEIELN